MKRKNENRVEDKDSEEVVVKKKSSKKVKKTVSKIVIAAISGGLVTFLLTKAWDSVERRIVRETEIAVMNKKINDISEDFSKQFDSINNEISELSKGLDSVDGEIKGIKKSIEDINSQKSEADKSVRYTINSQGIGLVIYTSEKIPTTGNEDCFELKNLSWEPNKVIGVGAADNQEYTPEELPEEPVLFIDRHGDYNLYSYGQVNDRNEWEGECLVNVYEKGMITLVTDGYYENGKLIRYKQAQLIRKNDEEAENVESIGDYKDNNRDKWSVSDRVRMGEYNDGTTIEYYVGKNYAENTELFTAEDMITIDDIISGASGRPASFYKGRTSNGKYNDETGKSYFVKYADDGTVVTLYNGGFANGVPNDLTGEAWEFARGEGVDEYIYYKGVFDMGKRDKSKIKYHISKEDILERIDGMKYDCELKWK